MPSASCSTTRAWRRARTSAPSSCPKPGSAPPSPCLRRLLGARGCGRARSARPAPRATPLCALLAGNLLLDQFLDEPRYLGVQELGHALLVTPDGSRELGRLGIADLLRERLDPRVDRDLDVFLAELLLRVPDMRLGLAGDQRPCSPHLSLDSGDGLSGHLADDVGDWSLDRGGRPAQLLDPSRHGALVVARLRQVLLQALLVLRLLGQLDVRGEIGLEFGLLRMRFIQPLNDLCVAFVHGPSSPSSGLGFALHYPGFRLRHTTTAPNFYCCLTPSWTKFASC